ncbi:hypothetical protein Vretimale_11014, partial [Volvox reticuliferus]
FGSSVQPGLPAVMTAAADGVTNGSYSGSSCMVSCYRRNETMHCTAASSMNGTGWPSSMTRGSFLTLGHTQLDFSASGRGVRDAGGGSRGGGGGGGDDGSRGGG